MSELNGLRIADRKHIGLAEMLKGGVIMDVTNARAGEDRRGRRRRGGHGARARALRHPQGRRRRPDVARQEDQGDPEGGHHPGHGEGADRALRRGADPGSPRGRLHRRVRGADARGRALPHRQVRLPHPLRVRLPRSRRGAPAHRRGRGHDPHEGRGRLRQHRRGGPPHARRHLRHPAAHDARARGADDRGEESGRPVRARCAGSPRRASSRCRTSRRAASRPRPTPR